MTQRQVDGGAPLGKDNEPGGVSEPADNTAYDCFRVKSTKHRFYAPKEKYKDLKDVLGLEDVNSDDAKKEQSIRLSQGSGYINLKVSVKGGGTLTVVCDPEQVGNALKNGASKKIYGKDINRIYIPKHQILR